MYEEAISAYPTDPTPQQVLYYWSGEHIDDTWVLPLGGNIFLPVPPATARAQTAGFCQDMEASSDQFCLQAKGQE